MTRNIVRYVAIGSAILLLSASVLYFRKQATPPESLTIADADQIVFALVYIADAQGYFKDEGLQVNYRKFKSGKDALADVVAGNADVATVYHTPVVADLLAGIPVRILSTLHRSNRNTAVVARRDRGINAIADLRGKRVAATRGTYQAELLNKMLDDEGIAPDEVRIVNMYHQDMPAALAGGAVDAGVTRWPYVGYAQDKLPSGTVVVLTTSLWSEVSVLATMQTTIERKQEAFARLMRALVRAEDLLARDNDAAYALAMSHWSRPATTDDRKIWEQIKFQLRLDNTLLQALQNEAAWLDRQGDSRTDPSILKSAMAGQFLSFIRPQFVLVRSGS
jgi:NitT/TauT family transport system substrate-binding protein